MSRLRVKWLGRNVPYDTGLMAMQRAAEAFHQKKEGAENTLFLLEHEDVITTTHQGGHHFLRTNPEALATDGIQISEAARGGDVTFHGKGQLVGYPVIRLPFMEGPPAGRVDILHYLRTLEGALVQTCNDLNLPGVHTQKDMTGVWVRPPETMGREAKLIAIGVGVKRGVTRHGFAFNLHTPLERFTKHIVPCGLENKAVTSLERALPSNEAQIPPLPQICRIIADHLAQGLNLETPPSPDFEAIPASLEL